MGKRAGNSNALLTLLRSVPEPERSPFRLIPAPEAARLLGLEVRTYLAYAARGLVPARKLGRSWYTSEAMLRAWAEAIGRDAADRLHEKGDDLRDPDAESPDAEAGAGREP